MLNEFEYDGIVIECAAASVLADELVRDHLASGYEYLGGDHRAILHFKDEEQEENCIWYLTFCMKVDWCYHAA